MPSSSITRGLGCLLGGVLVTLAFAPFNLYPLVLAGPLSLLYCWHRCSPGTAFVYGYLCGLGLFGSGLYWLHISINLFGGVNLPGAWAATALLVMYMALYPALVGYLGRRFFAANETVFMLLAAPCLWTLLEWTRSWFLTGFPWLNLGYSQLDTVLAGYAPLVGVYGLSGIVFLVATLLALLLRYRRRYLVPVLLALLLVLVNGYSLQAVHWTRPLARELQVALVQGGIPQHLKWRPELREDSLALYLELSAPHLDGDLILWPETAIPAYQYQVPQFMQRLADLGRATDTVFVTGLPYKQVGQAEYYNSMLLLDNGQQSYYHKQHLVPFGEYLPLKPLLSGILHFLDIPMSDFSPGNSDKPLLVAERFTLGASICYEDAFGEEVIRALPEAGLLVNISNDAWFGDSLAPHQHLQMARMRALETGRYLLRGTNTGISAIIAPDGGLVETSEQFQANTLSARVTLYAGTTPYARLGNWPVVLLALLGLAISLWLPARTRPKD